MCTTCNFRGTFKATRDVKQIVAFDPSSHCRKPILIKYSDWLFQVPGLF